MILETERLYLREMNQSDYGALCRILQDEETMYAYEGAFDDTEVQEWLDRQLARYQRWGFGLWAVVLKETDGMIGQCGLTMQPWKDREVLEIGYLFERAYWHRGYAVEAAGACRRYAFETLGAEEICSIIRDTNTASQNVAIRNGMVRADSWTKHYRGVDMPHDRYVAFRHFGENLRRLTMNYMTATSDMAEAIYDVLQTTIQTVYPKYYPKEVADFFCRHHSRGHILEGIASGNMRVLTNGNVIVGTGCFDGNHITGLYVLPAYQKQGCGSRIMDGLEEEIGKKHTAVVLDASLPAVCFYEHRGYQTVGHGSYELEHDVRLIYEVMEKMLRVDGSGRIRTGDRRDQ